MSTSVVVDRPYFGKTSEMARVKSFDCPVANLCSFILIFMYDADSLLASRPFDIPKFKKRAQTFSPVSLSLSQCKT